MKKNKLIVSFGGIAMAPGLPPKEFKRVLNDIDCDQLFITDPNRVWYYFGINDKILSHDDMVHYLRDYIRGYNDVLFVGNSMGGFAAILFGSRLNVNRVVAFSPQTFLSQRLREKHGDKRWRDLIGKLVIYDEFLELDSLMEVCDTVIDIYYSIGGLDEIHAEMLRDTPRAEIWLHGYKGYSHDLVKHFRDTGRLKEILSCHQ